MNGLHCLTGESLAPDIRLVCRNHKQKSELLDSAARLEYTWQNLEINQTARRIGLTGANQGTVDDAVAIEEDRSAAVVQRIGVGAYRSKPERFAYE
jgi:hypothetical protein